MSQTCCPTIYIENVWAIYNPSHFDYKLDLLIMTTPSLLDTAFNYPLHAWLDPVFSIPIKPFKE